MVCKYKSQKPFNIWTGGTGTCKMSGYKTGKKLILGIKGWLESLREMVKLYLMKSGESSDVWEESVADWVDKLPVPAETASNGITIMVPCCTITAGFMVLLTMQYPTTWTTHVASED